MSAQIILIIIKVLHFEKCYQVRYTFYQLIYSYNLTETPPNFYSLSFVIGAHSKSFSIFVLRSIFSPNLSEHSKVLISIPLVVRTVSRIRRSEKTRRGRRAEGTRRLAKPADWTRWKKVETREKEAKHRRRRHDRRRVKEFEERERKDAGWWDFVSGPGGRGGAAGRGPCMSRGGRKVSARVFGPCLPSSFVPELRLFSWPSFSRFVHPWAQGRRAGARTRRARKRERTNKRREKERERGRLTPRGAESNRREGGRGGAGGGEGRLVETR